MRVAVTIAAVLSLLSASTASAATAPKPKPWQWTTAQAQAKIDAAIPPSLYGDFNRYSKSTCRGLGKQVARRYTAFACSFTTQARPAVGGNPARPAETKTAWLKVRPEGKGGACISVVALARINPACLSAKGLVAITSPTPAGLIQVAMTKRFRPESTIPWQGFTKDECLGADGFYECAFESAVSGTAIVTGRRSGVTVQFVTLTCTGAYAGRPECNP